MVNQQYLSYISKYLDKKLFIESFYIYLTQEELYTLVRSFLNENFRLQYFEDSETLYCLTFKNTDYLLSKCFNICTSSSINLTDIDESILVLLTSMNISFLDRKTLTDNLYIGDNLNILNWNFYQIFFLGHNL